MRHIIGAGAVLLLALGAHPAAASPYKVAGLDAADSFEIKLLAEYSDQGGEKILEGPVLDLTAPLGPGLETSITFGRGRLEANGRTRAGTIDTEIAVKWEIVPLDEKHQVGVSVEPALFLPTGTHGLSDDEFSLELPVFVGWSSGPLHVTGLVGYARSLESSDDEILWGLLAEHDVVKGLSVGAEITGGMPSDAFGDYEAVADVGFVWEMTDATELQGRIGQTIRTADHQTGRQAGLYLEVAF